MEQGVIVGCDQKLEWILPWWWEHYSAYNNYPVIFFDFGMSETGKTWCKKKGLLKSLDSPPPPSSKEISLEKRIMWECQYGENVWEVRTAWLQKPMALLQSPFSLSCWLDLDCRVNGNLKSLFDLIQEKDDFAVSKYENENPTHHHPDMWNYNSAVIVFRKQAKLLKIWAQSILESPNELPGDEDYLSRAIKLHHFPIVLVPPIYNWSWTKERNDKALIVHFHGGQGKITLLKNIGQERFSHLFD